MWMLLPPYWQMFSCSLVLTCDVTIRLRRFVSLYCFHGAGFAAAGFVALTFPPTATWLMASFRIVSTIVLESDSFFRFGVTASLCLVPLFIWSCAVRLKVPCSSSGRRMFLFRDAMIFILALLPLIVRLEICLGAWTLLFVAAILPFIVLLYELSAS